MSKLFIDRYKCFNLHNLFCCSNISENDFNPSLHKPQLNKSNISILSLLEIILAK